jgi:hypothetical protein
LGEAHPDDELTRKDSILAALNLNCRVAIRKRQVVEDHRHRVASLPKRDSDM